MIVIVSWILYSCLAPKSMKEWRNAGLVQAFIIALYAEMYGFPLTIYLLTSFLGIDIPWLHTKGHLWGTLLGLDDTGAGVGSWVSGVLWKQRTIIKLRLAALMVSLIVVIYTLFLNQVFIIFLGALLYFSMFILFSVRLLGARRPKVCRYLESTVV